ncbi:MAG: Fe-S cluster assembly ATPase SufC [Alphaproteobacteria bacterium]|nr:Fe-S cluster assembly ATPase SufC [Alphaproteobacteria bacterium]
MLEIKNLSAGIAESGKEIIKGLNLVINAGETHAIMGPNGAGKSTLSYVITGKSDYAVTDGEMLFEGQNLCVLKPEERAALGIFLSMQSPIEIPGVTTQNFLKHSVNAVRKYNNLPELDAAEFLKLLRTAAKEFDVSTDMLKREINVGFSGGEKKRMEILQLSLLQPKLAILDEADSGLDIDALKIVANGVNQWHNQNNSLLIITHHLDLLKRIKPDFVHIYSDGHIVKTGDMALAEELETSGYKNYLKASV